MMAHAPSRRLYLSHYARVTDRRSGWILCADLVTGEPIWHRKYESAVDRGAITPDGKKIYMRSGETGDTANTFTSSTPRPARSCARNAMKRPNFQG